MAGHASEVAVGSAVLAVALGFALYAANATGGGRGGGEHYSLKAAFRSVQGVSVGTPVRLAGVEVGRLTDISLDPVSFRAVTTVSVRDTLELPSDSSIEIASEGLLGGNYIEIVPGGMPDTLQPGDQFTYTQGAVSLLTLLSKFVGSGADGGGGAEGQ